MKKITADNPLSHSVDITRQNIETLKALFPTIVKEGKIDLEELKALLGDEIEDGEEYYRFTWAGKAMARREANKPSTATLRPNKADSKDWDTTQNIFIEGDNLEVLKLLQKSYADKIKMIYIDPPYNTGNDFVYKDNYGDNLGNYLTLTGQVDDEGRKMGTNTESDGRYHSNWLNMIYPRLKLARALLKDNGAIFISIDDNEVQNLRKICDEIFGEDNFRNIFTVRRYDKNLNRQFIENGLKSFNVGFEYILCYSKTSDFNFYPVFKESSEERQSVGYWKGFWNDAERPTMRYDILGYTPPTGQWKWKRDTAIEAVNNYIDYTKNHSDITLEQHWENTGKKLKFIRRNPNGQGKNKGVENWIAPSTGILRNTNWTDMFASKNEAIIESVFDFPKNRELIKMVIESSCEDFEVVLDFFAGSGTTAHAIMQLNSEDGGSRKYICVQLPEPTSKESEAFKEGYKSIAEITKERIRRAGEKLKADRKKDLFNGTDNNVDIGFKAFKLDTSNIRAWDGNPENFENNLFNSASNIKEGRTEEDVLFEILLKNGLDLTLPIEEKAIAGKKVFNIGAGALFICLADNITTAVAEGIGKWVETLTPSTCKVIFKDNGFTDVEKTNSIQILKRYGVTDVNSI